MLVDPDAGRVMFIGLLATEADLRESDAALEEISPPGDMGSRAYVDVYEVGADIRM
jgi:hypothetical protein